MVTKIDLSIEELVLLAKTEDPKSDKAQPEKRAMKDIEEFVTTLGLTVGRKKIHNLILFDLYSDWQISTQFPKLTRLEFQKGMSFFFQKTLDKQRNVCFKVSPIMKIGKLKTTPAHLENLREKYGQKKAIETVEEQIPRTGPNLKQGLD